MAIPQHIFRAYDIRGLVDSELTPDTVYQIGLAIGSYALSQGESTIVMGRDARGSSPSLSFALGKALLAVGCDVIDIGVVPTPVLYYATKHLNIGSGVMMTGSHNPCAYNGLKMVIANKTLAGATILELYNSIEAQNFSHGKTGSVIENNDITSQYIEEICQRVSLARRLKIVIDCGNGVAGAVAPALFNALGCDVIPLYCEVKDNFPNHHPDPSCPENLTDLQQAVIEHQADLGLAFDGDGDRLGVVCNQGDIIWPDRQLMLLAQALLAEHAQAKIVFDVKCTNALKQVISDAGGIPIMCKTGHSLVKQTMQAEKALLAGEMSGHIFYQDRWYGFDDALYSAARFLEIVSQRSETVNQLFAQLPNQLATPEIKVPVEETEKFSIIEQLTSLVNFPEAQVIDIDGLRCEFDDGWGLVRVSNTSPCLTLRFEAFNQDALNRIQTLFRNALQQIKPTWQLPF